MVTGQSYTDWINNYNHINLCIQKKLYMHMSHDQPILKNITWATGWIIQGIFFLICSLLM